MAALRVEEDVAATQRLIENAVKFPLLSVRRERKCSTELPAHLARTKGLTKLKQPSSSLASYALPKNKLRGKADR